MKKLLILMCFCLSFLSSAFADWDPGDSYKMHFPQLPDPTGWDVCLCCQWIADDFVCSETGNITDIHFWISWNEDLVGEFSARDLDVSIWSSAAVAGMPGTKLWQLVGGNVVVRPYGQGPQGWVCPSPPALVVPNNHFQFFQVNITQIPEPFRQMAGTTYWLVIKINLPSPPWPNGPAVGWKTSTTQFQAPSLWSIDKVNWQPVFSPDVEIWDQAFVITNDGQQEALDFGDAPDPLAGVPGQYPTLLVNNGARHIITAVGPWLGDPQDNPDPEADGQPTINADGDDNDGNDDEDGVQIPALTVGQTSTISFEVNSADGIGGTVSGWIDFDGSGVWGDMATELIVATSYANGIYNVTVTPPAGSVVGNTYARFRITRDTTVTGPTGLASDGEVEDYKVTIREEQIQAELKFQQLPLNGPMYFGHDELSTVYPVYDNSGGTEPILVEYHGCYMADDFADLASSPVIRVKWWGSYFGNEIVQPVLSFIIAFESDVPAVGGQPGQPDFASHPGVILSKEEVLRDMDGVLVPGEFSEMPVGPGGPPCNEALYQYEALLKNPFQQKPNTVYWLKIVAVVELPFNHTLWQDVAQWGGDVCDYLVNGYGHLPQQYQPVTRWGWHNRDYTVRDPYASKPPAVMPGEHLAGTVLNPAGGIMDVWHFQDDAVAGHVFMPVDPTGQPRKIMDVIQIDWLEQYYKYYLSYCHSPTQQGVDGPEGIGQYSKDMAFELWTGPETVSTPTVNKITPAPAIADRVNSGRVETFIASGAVSSLGHALEYQFTWGDTTVGPWGAATQTHVYIYGATAGPLGVTYNVTVQARCIAHPTVVSATSAPLVETSEAVKSTAAFYAAWAQFGRLDCWAFQRNCRGDADNILNPAGKGGIPPAHWVGSPDLIILASAWQKADADLTGNKSCADFDRIQNPAGKGGIPPAHWVGSPDLIILAGSWQKAEVDTPVCDQTNYHYWTN